MYVVGGFAAGVLLVGDAGELQRRLRRPTTQYVQAVVGSLKVEASGYYEELRAAERRGDYWLAGRLTDRLMRHAYFAWFAQEGHYCPFPKHVDEWVRHLGLSRRLTELHAEVWRTSDRAAAIERFVAAVVDSD